MHIKKTIKIKLGLVIGVLLSLILVVGLTAYFQTNTINSKVAKIVDVEHKSSETAYQVKINLVETGVSVQKYMHDYSRKHLVTLNINKEKFQKFQNEFNGVLQTDDIKKLGLEMNNVHLRFEQLADSLMKKQDEQLLLIDSCRISFNGLIAILDDESYDPVKRFDAHKDAKMRAAIKVQQMKVSVNQLISNLENYLKVQSLENETAMSESQNDFLNSFNQQQRLARPGYKEKFAKLISKSFEKTVFFIDEIVAKEKQKQKMLIRFETTQREISALLEEQVLIIANKNLIESKEDAIQTAKRSNLIILFLMVFTLLFGVITGFIFTRSLTRPLNQLVKATKVIAASDFTQKVDIHSDDELEDLGASFNQMTRQLQIAQEEQIALLFKIEKSNKELEDFAHVVSHDLKAPLRGISSLSEWLSTDYADKLGPDGVEQLNLLKSRVKRMFDMIDGILKYSKVGRVEERKENLELTQFVKDTVQFLAVPDKFEVIIQEDLPTIAFDRIRLQQIFQNLISNAVKYNNKEKGLIQIKCVDDNHFWKFSVSDNGPGIEEKNLAKIFKLFQTIQPIDDRESTGVGLAIVQKIILGVGGKIWAESVVGEGSVFYFTLPKNIQKM